MIHEYHSTGYVIYSNKLQNVYIHKYTHTHTHIYIYIYIYISRFYPTISQEVNKHINKVTKCYIMYLLSEHS
jgi:hypothetical protein